jgi:thioredoxin reductase
VSRQSSIAESWDVVVIGGGGAGLSAALTLTRALRRTLLLDAGYQRNRLAEHSHGVLGLDGTAPSRFVETGRAEVLAFGGEIRDDVVVTAERDDDGFVLSTARDGWIRCRQLVVATGVRDEIPRVPGLAEHWGRQVVICPYCDGWELRGQRIGILATGAKSVSQAQLVRQWSENIVFFDNNAVALDSAVRAEFDARGITVVEGAVSSVEGAVDGALSLVGPAGEHRLDALFVAPKAVPRDALLRALGARTTDTAAGAFVAVDATGATSVPGLWAAGNVVDPSLKIATAVGNGMATATHVNESLVRADVLAALEKLPV